jgi:hypothetical protein
MKISHPLLYAAACAAALMSDCTSVRPPIAPEKSGCTLSVINSSSYTITAVYFSSTSASLGTDELAGSIAAGSSFDITDITAGTYYLRAVRASRNDTAYVPATVLADGQSYTWTLTDANFFGGSTGNATVSVTNNSTTTVGWLYLSSISGTLGTDQLGSDMLPVGNTFNVTSLPAGTYYFRAVHSELHDTAFKTITLTAGQTYTWTLTDAAFTPANGGVRKFMVSNSSSFAVTAVYVSQSNTTWGNNLLGSSTISPGSSYTFSDLPQGYSNVKVVTSDATRYALHLVYIPSGGTDTLDIDDAGLPTSPHGSLKIVNTSSTEIYYLYDRVSGTSSWSDDMLGSSTIPAGQSLQINVIDPGTYDLYAESAGGTYAELDGQSITAGELRTWTVSSLY